MGVASSNQWSHLHERVPSADLERHGFGGPFELLDEGADVVDGDFECAESGQSGGHAATTARPDQVLAHVKRDGAVAGHQGPSREQRGGVGQRHPTVGVLERGKRPLLGGERQSLGHAGLTSLASNEGNEGVDNCARYAGTRGSGTFLAFDGFPHVRHPTFPHRVPRTRDRCWGSHRPATPVALVSCDHLDR